MICDQCSAIITEKPNGHMPQWSLDGVIVRMSVPRSVDDGETKDLCPDCLRRLVTEGEITLVNRHREPASAERKAARR
jgi:hypothetical protein